MNEGEGAKSERSRCEAGILEMRKEDVAKIESAKSAQASGNENEARGVERGLQAVSSDETKLHLRDRSFDLLLDEKAAQIRCETEPPCRAKFEVR